MFYVYILRSKVNGKFYIGSSRNLEDRIRRHNSGRCAYTKKYLPWKLEYFEIYSTREEAVRRERYLKSLKSKRVIEVIVGRASRH